MRGGGGLCSCLQWQHTGQEGEQTVERERCGWGTLTASVVQLTGSMRVCEAVPLALPRGGRQLLMDAAGVAMDRTPIDVLLCHRARDGIVLSMKGTARGW